MRKRERVGAREGYDLWSDTYDATPNPVVAMDRRHTIAALAARPGEPVLDAGCGTGRNLAGLLGADARPVGMDFSAGMLAVAHQRHPEVPLLVADLHRPLPLRDSGFDAVLCALVGEHLAVLDPVFAELHRMLRPGGRLIFSVYHPEMAARGIEANFEREGVEYRLGAYQHTIADYTNAMARAGLTAITHREFAGDEQIAREVPSAVKYVGFPLLVILEGRRE